MLPQVFQRYTFFVVLLLVMVWAWFIQANTYMNLDTGWFLEATERMLAGGNYTNDFFENNPPWILYLTIPPVIFAKTFSVSLVLAMRIYVFSFAITSLGISYYFLLKIFIKSDLYLARLITVVLAFLFLVLPTFEFGQRENLFFIFSMPYLLMMEYRLQGRDVNLYLAIGVGLLAGLVFILKPYFLMTLLLVELYYLVQKKSLKAMIRPEIMSIMVLLIAYSIIIVLYHRDYLAVVLPIAARYCYFGVRNAWVNLFFSQFCMVCYFSVLFCLVSYNINRFRSLTILFLLALLGFLFSYAVQQEDVYYRLIPAYAMSLLLFMLAFASYISTPIKLNNAYLWIFYFALVLMIYLKRTTYLLDYYPLFYPLLSFIFVTAVFLMVLYLLPSCVKLTAEFYKRFLMTFFLMGGLIYGLFCYLDLTELPALVVNFLAIIVYGCLIPSDYKHKKYYIAFIFVGCAIALLPFFQIFYMVEITKNNKKDYERLVNDINVNIPQESYYFFATDIPYFMEQKANNVSRFSFFWFLPGLVKQSYHLNNKESYELYNKDKKFFVDIVAKDLMIKKPKWVFVDNLTKKSYLFWRTTDSTIVIPFNYLTYFGDNKNFNEVWKNYRYFKNLIGYHYTRLNPYQYQLHLNYKHVPEESAVEFQSLYLYLNHKDHLEMAFRDKDKHLKRMEVSLNDNQLRGIKHVLETPGMNLERRDRTNFFRWVLNQSIAYELYNYDVYQRRT